MAKLRLAVAMLAVFPAFGVARADDGSSFYRLQSELKLGGSGAGWDHIDYDPTSRRAYLNRRADGLTVVDVTTNQVVGEVANAKGSGAMAFSDKLDRGFTANGDGTTSVFKLSDLSPVDRVKFGDDFDGVVYDESTNLLAYQQQKAGKEIFVDPTTMKQVGSVDVDGHEPERPVVDGKGVLYLAVRDTASVYKIDIKTQKVLAKWDVSSKCTQPSGTEFDVASNRLILPCRGGGQNPLVAIIDADTGAITATMPTGRGADDVILDPKSKQLFVPCGADAIIDIFRQDGPDAYTPTQALQTRPGMKGLRYDAASDRMFGITAEGYYDPAKKHGSSAAAPSPNAIFPGTFVMLTWGKGAPSK